MPCPGLSSHVWVTSSLNWGVGPSSVVCLPGGHHQQRFRGVLGSLTAARSVAVCWWNWEAEVKTELGQVLGSYLPAGPCAVRKCTTVCWAQQGRAAELTTYLYPVQWQTNTFSSQNYSVKQLSFQSLLNSIVKRKNHSSLMSWIVKIGLTARSQMVGIEAVFLLEREVSCGASLNAFGGKTLITTCFFS